MDDPYPPFGELDNLLKGEVLTDTVSRTLYATDASVYRELPMAVVMPRDATDIALIVGFAARHKIPLIPRGAGTSLAGQVVGHGLVVDLSHHMNRILHIDAKEKWAEVQPGVVLDDLNREAATHGLFFGPETSTANRCTLAGMVANNSCGSHSMVYGSTRDHIIEISGCLSNGEEVTFRPLQKWEFDKKCRDETLEGDIYRFFREVYTDRQIRKQIRKEFPHPDIHRRNSGYALDELLDTAPFKPDSDAPLFNLSKLIAGSEGSLLFITSVKVALVPPPLPNKGLLCVHFTSLREALEANILAVEHHPDAVELMDHNILELTKGNSLQRSNRFFIEGEPAALLLIEFSGASDDEVIHKSGALISAFKKNNYGYSYPLVSGPDINRVWNLRKAGLGVLSNMKGDARPVSLIEDTAVRVKDLPAYVEAIDQMLAKYHKNCVYHAHVGSGELHIRPVLNLRHPDDIKLFRQIGEETARIVKSFRGSLSGEHGDGRLRGEFIPLMVGTDNYELMKKVKTIFDPDGLFNPGKIIDTPPMDSSFRYTEQKEMPITKTVFNWSDDDGLMHAVERCNGSADCLKNSLAGGVMCPSYRGTRDERHSTRGRANILRAFLQGQNSGAALTTNDLAQVLDLCLSCKACKNECPSSVDMARLKAEFLQYMYDQEGTPFTARIMGQLPRINRIIAPFFRIYNLLIRTQPVKQMMWRFAGITKERTLPAFSSKRLDHWVFRHPQRKNKTKLKTIILLADEFTNFYDGNIGIKTVLLLRRLGYYVQLAPVKESGRTQISKGLLRKASAVVKHNLLQLKGKISNNQPLVGIEPSTILTFRDEYPDLAPQSLRQTAREIAKNTFTIEEFLATEMKNGNIRTSSFTSEAKTIRFHGHCYQKALSDTSFTKQILSFPENYMAEEIQSGCCGMAGGFGYEDNHYSLSMKIGELSLFPEVRKTPESTILVSAGHSCRHQIKDGTGRTALHPVEVLFDALL
ncbi:FAD-binding and (Fe-S)-binding domain-containing protein [Geofilum sp. OHC36d9]|uniref:FAD-binding and (Fe-S)-binding domain-containing protein n=1 Tax=Geofilum sp. OHC36d9 TaxID=3458413 RepID=UPI004034BF02